MIEVLRNRTYRSLFLAQVLALLGTGLLTIALGLLAFAIAGDAAGSVLGTALTIKMVAYVGVAPLVAALVDRLPKKVVLVTADVIRLAVALSLPLVTETWQIYVLVFVLQSASATFTPAFQSLIPSVLTEARDYTPRALAVTTGVRPRSHPEPCHRRRPAHADQLHPPVHRYRDRVRVLGVPRRGHPPPRAIRRRLRRLVLATAPDRALGVLPNPVAAVRDAREHRRRGGHGARARELRRVRPGVFHLDDTGLAVALASYGVGSLAVAFGIPRLVGRWGVVRVMVSGSILIVVGLVAAIGVTAFSSASGEGWGMLLATWAVLGVGTSLVNTPSSRLLAEASTPANRNLVYTAQFALSHACFLVTYPIAGWVGAQSLLGAAAALAVVAAVACAAVIAPSRRLVSEARRAASRNPASGVVGQA